jgi:hypothetical protein
MLLMCFGLSALMETPHEGQEGQGGHVVFLAALGSALAANYVAKRIFGDIIPPFGGRVIWRHEAC